MRKLLYVIAGVLVFRGLRGLFGRTPRLPMLRMPGYRETYPNDYSGRVEIPCGEAKTSTVTYTSSPSSIVLVRVEQQCSDAHPVRIRYTGVGPDAEEQRIADELLNAGDRRRVGYTYAVSVGEGRALRISCGNSLVRRGECVFHVHKLERDVPRNAWSGYSEGNGSRITGACGATVSGRFYNLSGRALKIKVRFRDKCRENPVMRFTPIAGGAPEDWALQQGASEREERMSDGYFLEVRCLGADLPGHTGCAFDVICTL